MEIRIANENDIIQIKNLLDRNFNEIMSEFHSKPILDKFMLHNTCESLSSQLLWKKVYVVEKNNRIIGTGAFVNFGSIENPKYCISNLYVLPEMHGKSIGRLIFDQLLNDAKLVGAKNFHVPSSINAIGFYKKMGFSIDEIQLENEDEITWMSLLV